MTERMNQLIGNDYSIKRFADMDAPAQMAIIWFMAVDGEAWDSVDLSSLSEDELKTGVAELIPQYVKFYGDVLFGCASLSTKVICDAVMCDLDIADGFHTWEQYHTWYLQSETPMHPKDGRWSVILSSDDDETLRDGWHRLHSYIRDGADEIPSVFFPTQDHLKAIGK